GFVHKALSTAFFGSPRIHHPTRIAAFISAIAPKLESIVTWDSGRNHPDSDKYVFRWELVQDLIFESLSSEHGRRVISVGEGAVDHGNEGLYNYSGVVQSAQETENGDVAVGGDVGEDGEIAKARVIQNMCRRPTNSKYRRRNNVLKQGQ
ncbi:hypothetical protein DFH29DRAFT_813883, partial [Suillus ampliporus]